MENLENSCSPLPGADDGSILGSLHGQRRAQHHDRTCQRDGTGETTEPAEETTEPAEETTEPAEETTEPAEETTEPAEETTEPAGDTTEG